MPKYSTVQAYSDNSAVQTVSYEQASGAAAAKGGPVRPEKVVNPYGSTAGANSGDFHLYRQTRAREMERMKQLTTEEAERQKDAEFEAKLQRDREEQELKTAKKRKKRQRHKEAKLRRKMLAKAGVNLEEDGDDDDFSVPAPITTKETKEKEEKEMPKQNEAAKDEANTQTDGVPAPPFPNDGSFLEMMKKQLEAQQSK